MSDEVSVVMPSEITVFVVEDDAGVRSALKMTIESFGWRASEFASAEAFLGAYVPGGEEFLVLDLHLTGMNGAALLQALRARRLHIPTVLMTARPDDALTKQCLTAGAAAVLTKPFKAAELLANVERTMSARACAE